MRVLSLFDGMACGMLAMLSAGINVDRYVAYEIDKYAVKTSSHNFPIIEHRGDVFHADFTEFSGFDFVLAGFPCTKFSIAQKNDRETQPYSGEGWLLFEQAWRAVCEAKPKYFVFENNKSMAKPVQEEISRIIGFPPICINSALVSAQNRQRLYWVGKRNQSGTYSKVHVDQPEDRGILLRDVLDGMTYREKGRCVLSSAGRTTTREYFEKNQGNMAFVPVYVGEIPEHNGKYRNGKQASQQYRVYSIDGKSVTCDQDSRKYIAQPVNNPIRVGCYPSPDGTIKNSQGMRIYSIDGKSVNLTSLGGGLGAKSGLYAFEVPVYAQPIEWDENGKPTQAVSGADGKTYPVFEVKDGQITIKGKNYPLKLEDGYYIIRKLTVSESKRRQTVPEEYEFPVSDTQAYKMLGNGWTVEVIAHLIQATQVDVLEEVGQLDLFEIMGV